MNMHASDSRNRDKVWPHYEPPPIFEAREEVWAKAHRQMLDLVANQDLKLAEMQRDMQRQIDGLREMVERLKQISDQRAE